MRPFNAFEQKNLKFLVNHNIKFTQVEVTPTGLSKSILDSTAPMRTYFLEAGVHDYSEQPQGQESKRMCDAIILTDSEQCPTQASFYRPNTKKGDPRMWIYKLTSYTNGNDIHVLFYFNDTLYSINITQVDIEKMLQLGSYHAPERGADGNKPNQQLRIRRTAWQNSAL